MTFLRENLEALARHHPDAAQQVALVASLDQGAWSPSRRGPPTVRRRGLALASAFDPQAEATRDLPLVVAEADPAWLVEVLIHRDLRPLLAHPFLVVLVGPDPSLLGDFLGRHACRTVETLAWRPLSQIEPGWQNALQEQVALAQARSRVNEATYQRFRGLWRRNLQKNQALFRDVRPLSALEGRWSGAPAVVAAAGPSLAANFGWMRSHRDQFVLIAVDTAWSSLAAQGFEPDILLVLDGQYWNARHLDRPIPEKTLVVTEWTGPSRAFRLGPARTFVAASSVPFLRQPEERRWGPLGALASGGSVATAAWSLALVLGCREVAFAGLDLGYPRGQTHVPGSQFEEALHRRSSRLCPAETTGLGLRAKEGRRQRPSLDGATVASDARMDLFRDWLSAAVALRPDVQAFNLGTRGSVIPGLLRPQQGYGDLWPRLAPRAPLKANPLVPPRVPDHSPPMDAEAAREFWGPEVWDAWMERARRTWERFPSPRSRRALEEAMDSALSWKDFLDDAFF